ncbi:hypothetical protein GCM10007989_06460 [Devosia pacifica]|uniref:Uncharacterized protein n=1 Tax=Devosia pacifica TaxID=1335967 RepID=A0A918RXD3_9HYPH|nr:hypothetical protein GCM10007989_06460 [Devosia pacifica]
MWLDALSARELLDPGTAPGKGLKECEIRLAARLKIAPFIADSVDSREAVKYTQFMFVDGVGGGQRGILLLGVRANSSA